MSAHEIAIKELNAALAHIQGAAASDDRHAAAARDEMEKHTQRAIQRRQQAASIEASIRALGGTPVEPAREQEAA